jgi:hypothetical protein
MTRPHVISHRYHEAAYSDFSFNETILFYEGLGVVLVVCKYDSGKTHVVSHGGTDENVAAAKAAAERGAPYV